VAAQQGAEVEVSEEVAVERQEALAEPPAERLGGEPDRAGGAARLGLDDVGEAHPAVLVPQLGAQHVGQEAAGEYHLLDPMRRQPLDHVGEKGPVDDGQRRLRHVCGERPQARAFATD